MAAAVPLALLPFDRLLSPCRAAQFHVERVAAGPAARGLVGRAERVAVGLVARAVVDPFAHAALAAARVAAGLVVRAVVVADHVVRAVVAVGRAEHVVAGHVERVVVAAVALNPAAAERAHVFAQVAAALAVADGLCACQPVFVALVCCPRFAAAQGLASSIPPLRRLQVEPGLLSM